MKYTQEQASILQKTPLTATCVSFTLHAPTIAAAATVGQFVNVLCDGMTLRRPISLCDIDPSAGTLRLVVENRGKGTAWLNERAVGDTLDLLGPLGHGFPDPDETDTLPAVSRLVLVGGGVGCPPLLAAARAARKAGAQVTVICGFRNAEAVMLQQDFADCGAEVMLCTDDGSAGQRGLVTAALEQRLAAAPCDRIYTCGPRIMMKAVADMAAAQDVPCWVSMEERMACGVGACLGCVCKTKTEHSGSHLAKVCQHGPVFFAQEVDWT